MSSSPLLDISGLSVRYGQLTALRDVQLKIAQGEIVFIAGPNGAGKSTLLRTIAGALRPHSGTVSLAGKPIAGVAPEKIAAMGFTLVPEGREIFEGLSVAENLALGAYLRRDKAEVAADLAFVLDELPDLKPLLAAPAGLLSGGQQQMLSIGRSLMTRASVIAIDEPSLGLAPKIIDRIYDVLIRLQAARGLTLLIAEQSFERAIQVDARLAILRNGQVSTSGQARALEAQGAIESAYFGY